MHDAGQDDWLYGAQCAELIGVSAATWRRYTTDGASRTAIAPKYGRRHPNNGRPQWSRGAVLAWQAGRVPNHLAGQRTHAAILDWRAARPLIHPATIANKLDLCVETVNRHLRNKCGCHKRSA